MKIRSRLLIVASLVLFSGLAVAQLRQIPKAVEETFSRQYNGATHVAYRDQLVGVNILFELNGEKMIAFIPTKEPGREVKRNGPLINYPAK